MIKTLLSAAVLMSLPVAAYATENTFERDGVTYVYTTEVQGDTTVLKGKSMPNGSRYKLYVRGTKVSGLVGNTPVNFRIAKPLASSLPANNASAD